MSSCPARGISAPRFVCGRGEKMAAAITLLFLLFLKQGTAVGSPGASALGWGEDGFGDGGGLWGGACG